MRYFLLVFGILMSTALFGQNSQKDTTENKPVGNGLFRVGYAAQIPLGDYSSRFGFTNHIGASAGYRTKSNWVFTFGGYYIFGDNVVDKNTLLSSMTNSSNLIITSGGEQALVNISQQGYYVNFEIAKIFPWAAPNPNSGFMFGLAGGFMEHWIGLRADENTVPQLLDDYEKGYDRLTNGIIIQEFIGYHFQGSSRLLNFYGGFEFTQGFTGNRRSYDIPTMSVKDENYVDFLIGFKVGWIMPFYKREKDKYYYY